MRRLRGDERVSERKMRESLKQQAINGVLWSGIQKFGISFISFISNIFLARLLTADDYGCIGLLAIFIAVSNALVLGGFISALIQKKDANETDFSTVFLWNIVVSITLYALLFLASPYIAEYYSIEKLRKILRIQGLILLINGLSAVQTTLLRKSLQFKKLATINLISASVSIMVALILAYKGFGVWSLVVQQLVSSSCNTLILWVTSTWRPSFIFSLSSFKGLFSYGCFLLLSDLMNTVCDNVQGLIIGKRFSSSTMGYYTQAKRLEEVPTQSISQLVAQVTFPIYARIQDDVEKLRSAVKGTLALMNFVNFPLMVMLIVIAKPLIVFLYSEKWINSIPYFQILCVAGIVNCLQSVNYQVVSATGRSKQLFAWNFVKRGSGIILIVIGALSGVRGILWGMVVSYYIIYFINAGLAYQSTHYSVLEQLVDSTPLLFIALVSGVVSYSFGYLINSNILLLIVQVLVYLLSYYLLALLFKRKEVGEIKSIIAVYFSRLFGPKNQ